MGNEVENLVYLTAKDVEAPEFFNYLDFEVVPARDVVEGSHLIQGDGIEGEHQLHRVIMSGQGESV